MRMDCSGVTLVEVATQTAQSFKSCQAHLLGSAIRQGITRHLHHDAQVRVN